MSCLFSSRRLAVFLFYHEPLLPYDVSYSYNNVYNAYKSIVRFNYMVKIFEWLIIGIIFMALFPILTNAFFNTTMYISTIGNNNTWTNTTAIPYPTLYSTIFWIVPLLVLVGLLYFFYHKSAPI